MCVNLYLCLCVRLHKQTLMQTVDDAAAGVLDNIVRVLCWGNFLITPISIRIALSCQRYSVIKKREHEAKKAVGPAKCIQEATS